MSFVVILVFFILDRRRLNAITRHFFETGFSRPEGRGGSRRTDDGQELTESVKAHIKEIPCTESHYGARNSVRQYLPAELSIQKLYTAWRQRREAAGLRVGSYSLYRKVSIHNL